MSPWKVITALPIRFTTELSRRQLKIQGPRTTLSRRQQLFFLLAAFADPSSSSVVLLPHAPYQRVIHHQPSTIEVCIRPNVSFPIFSLMPKLTVGSAWAMKAQCLVPRMRPMKRLLEPIHSQKTIAWLVQQPAASQPAPVLFPSMSPKPRQHSIATAIPTVQAAFTCVVIECQARLFLVLPLCPSRCLAQVFFSRSFCL